MAITMDNDSKFQRYAKELVRDVPVEIMQYLVNLFMAEAAVNMGNDFDEKTLERTIYYIRQQYSYIPVYFVASAFVRGSLGDFGPGRLVYRTIHGWLNEITLEYNRSVAKEKLKAQENDVSIAMDLHTFPIGKAIIQKINWYREGRLNGDRWDRIDLKRLAEAIGNNEHIVFENFWK